MQRRPSSAIPNIVLAFDAGEVDGAATPPANVLRYFVMEYVTGPEPRTARPGRRAAAPVAGLRLNPPGRRRPAARPRARPGPPRHQAVEPAQSRPEDEVEDPRLRPGPPRAAGAAPTPPCSAPSTTWPRSRPDARSVDIRADIYGLGGTLYWLLTGQKPFPGDRPPVEELLAPATRVAGAAAQPAPRIPLELEAIVCQMMARDPNDRYPTPLAVLTALNDFLDRAPPARCPPGATRDRPRHAPPKRCPDFQASARLQVIDGGRADPLVLVVSRPGRRAAPAAASCWTATVSSASRRGSKTRSSTPWCRSPCDLSLIDATCPTARSCAAGCAPSRRSPTSKLILLDPRRHGPAFGRRGGPTTSSRRHRPAARTRGAGEDGAASEGSRGPLRPAGPHLLATGRLDQRCSSATTAIPGPGRADLRHGQDGGVRGQETGGHLLRMQSYVRVLAEEAMRLPAFAPASTQLHPHAGALRPAARHWQGGHPRPRPVEARPPRAEERSIMESHTPPAPAAGRGGPAARRLPRLSAHGHRHRPQPPRALRRPRLPRRPVRRGHFAGRPHRDRRRHLRRHALQVGLQAGPGARRRSAASSSTPNRANSTPRCCSPSATAS